jgi:hypothetical protein
MLINARRRAKRLHQAAARAALAAQARRARRSGQRRHSGGEARMSAGMAPALGRCSFRRIVDIPFETCVAALCTWPRTGPDRDLHVGESALRGPVEHDSHSGTRRIEVRLARGPLRPPLYMRLEIDRWSDSATALELIPGRRVRPSAAYFRAGHLLLDALTHSLRGTCYPGAPPPTKAASTPQTVITHRPGPRHAPARTERTQP